MPDSGSVSCSLVGGESMAARQHTGTGDSQCGVFTHSGIQSGCDMASCGKAFAREPSHVLYRRVGVPAVVGIGYDACLLSRQRPRGDDGLLFGLPDILLHIAGSPFGFLRSCVQSFVTDTNVVRIHIIYNKK